MQGEMNAEFILPVEQIIASEQKSTRVRTGYIPPRNSTWSRISQDTHNYLPYDSNNTHEIDPHLCDLCAFLELYDSDDSINFKFNNQFNNGYGRGANIYCKTILLKRVIDYFFEEYSNTAYIVPKFSLFPQYETITSSLKIVHKIFKFIKSCVDSNVLLPKHFHPAFINIILRRCLTYDELMYYLNQMDSDMYKYISKLDESYRINSTKFQEISPDYESLEAMLGEKVVGNGIIGRDAVICACFRFNFIDAIELDSSISEPHIITNELVVAVFKITPIEYEILWHRFVMDLSQEELKTMLILFAGSTAIPAAIYLRVDDMKCDLNIHVCGYSLSINKRLFESYDVLSRLKIYFASSVDDIDDSDGDTRRLNVQQNLINNPIQDIACSSHRTEQYGENLSIQSPIENIARSNELKNYCVATATRILSTWDQVDAVLSIPYHNRHNINNVLPVANYNISP
jgi:hypothetical protein